MKALKHSKKGKVEGPSGVMSEIIKTTGDKRLEGLTNLYNDIIVEGHLDMHKGEIKTRTREIYYK